MITIALLAAILVTLMVIAAILIGLLLRLDAVEQQVNRFRNEWVQLRRDDPGRVRGQPRD
jgi:type IV secretory pathway component VirB8